MQRFEIEGIGSEVYGGVLVRHLGCPSSWEIQIDTFAGDFSTLAELVQRAEEHTEVCR